MSISQSETTLGTGASRSAPRTQSFLAAIFCECPRVRKNEKPRKEGDPQHPKHQLRWATTPPFFPMQFFSGWIPSRLRTLPSAEDAPDDEYTLKGIQTPVLTGLALNCFISLFESAAGPYIYPILALQSGITQVGHASHLTTKKMTAMRWQVLHGVVAHAQPSFLPELPVDDLFEPGCQALSRFSTAEEAVSSTLRDGFISGFGNASETMAHEWRASARDYVRAYQSSKEGGRATTNTRGCGPRSRPPFTFSDDTTPTRAMERLVSFLKLSEAQTPPCAWLISWSEDDILRQAKQSTERYASGTARLLEGVPFAVKDVADALPYKTTAGTSFMASRQASMIIFSLKIDPPLFSSLSTGQTHGPAKRALRLCSAEDGGHFDWQVKHARDRPWRHGPQPAHGHGAQPLRPQALHGGLLIGQRRPHRCRRLSLRNRHGVGGVTCRAAPDQALSVLLIPRHRRRRFDPHPGLFLWLRGPEAHQRPHDRSGRSRNRLHGSNLRANGRLRRGLRAAVRRGGQPGRQLLHGR